MDLKEKVLTALMENLKPEYLRIEDESGITGFIVANVFRGVSSLDRQKMIDDTLKNSSNPLSTKELRQVLLIAGLTPEEYRSVG
ncbi:MAG: hypothetical protein ACKO0V_10685, partial [bacterium]